MKILFVCHRLPFPPKRGGKIRPFNIIRHLTESGHSVTVGSLARSEEELEEGQPLSEYCDKLIVGQINAAAAVARMVARLANDSCRRAWATSIRAACTARFREELQQNRYDLVFVHCSSVAQYVSSANGVPSILDFGDMDSQKWLDYSSYRRFPLSMGYWLEGTKLCREEKRLARRFDLSTCTTQAELETLRGFDAARQTDWFPNGVDAEFFSPTDEPYDPDQICFIGRMDYYPNQQAMLNFCNSVLPLIQVRRPATKLTIVGAEPSVEIRKSRGKTRCHCYRHSAGRAGLCSRVSTIRCAACHCPRYSEQDSGVHGDGRAGDLQQECGRWSRRGARATSPGCRVARSVRRSRYSIAGERGRATGVIDRGASAGLVEP